MIDLHMHSYYSDDGEFSPENLVRQCAQKGITLMSITDHNSVKANKEARRAAGALGIEYTAGVEVDCTYAGFNFHLLGYGIDENDPAFAKIEEDIRIQEKAASRVKLQKTREMGFEIEEAQLEALALKTHWPESWTGEQFAQVLLDMPAYKDHPLLMPYREGGERSVNPLVNFYWVFMPRASPASRMCIFHC